METLVKSSHHSHGLLLIATGLAIRLIIGRRRFNRRSITGVPLYSSYFTFLLTSVLERLFNFIGLAAMIAGAWIAL